MSGPDKIRNKIQEAVSGGSPAILRPLTPLTVPLLLKPRGSARGPRVTVGWRESSLLEG
jgi:hypothetical protein